MQKLIAEIKPAELDFSTEEENLILSWDENQELALKKFCEIYNKLLSKVVPKVSVYFRRVAEFSYSSSEICQLVCKHNRYF